MSLQLRPCFQETCGGFILIDRTGAYNEDTNPGGYGEENDVTGPGDFDTYRLLAWPPGADTSGDPVATLNLLPPPEPYSNFHFQWEFFASDLGLEEIASGLWYFEVIGVKDGQTYDQSAGPIFTREVSDKLQPVLDKFDPTCPCKAGCQNPYELLMALKAIECGGVCDSQKAERIIRYVRNNIKNCC